MGTKTSVLTTVPATTHVSAAQALGRDPTVINQLIVRQINDVLVTLKQAVKDMTVGNVSDANIAAYNTLITNLS